MSDNLVNVDARIEDPYQSAAWRWGRATELIRLGLFPDPHDDPAVCAAWAYLWDTSQAQTQKEMTAARQRHALLTAADHIYLRAGSDRQQLETLLRAGVDVATIATAIGLPEVVVQAYEAVFCHVTHIAELSLFESALGVFERQSSPASCFQDDLL